MDHVYKARDYTVYNVKESLKSFSEEVLSEELPKNLAEIRQKSKLSDEDFEKMRTEIQSTVVDYREFDLNCEVNLELPEPFNLFSKDALELQTVKLITDEKIRKQLDENRENRQRYRSKFQDLTRVEEKMIDPDVVPYTQVVLTIRFYLPFSFGRDKRSNPRFHQEFLVLSSQYLSELRDKIYCQCNYGPFQDISENPFNIFDSSPIDKVDPGFFFIHDTFYNDTRNPLNPDYSDEILKWSKRHAYIRDFKTEKMEDTKFEDLKMRIGYPCVYQHQGACEHLFTVTSIELVNNTDNLFSSDYPILANISTSRSFACFLCGQREIMFVVKDCPIHVQNPVKVCEECFRSFHYVDGKKIYSFTAYRYHSVRPE